MRQRSGHGMASSGALHRRGRERGPRRWRGGRSRGDEPVGPAGARTGVPRTRRSPGPQAGGRGRAGRRPRGRAARAGPRPRVRRRSTGRSPAGGVPGLHRRVRRHVAHHARGRPPALRRTVGGAGAEPRLDDPLPVDGPFDAVVSSFAIHHVDDERKASLAAECAALLLPAASSPTSTSWPPRPRRSTCGGARRWAPATTRPIACAIWSPNSMGSAGRTRRRRLHLEVAQPRVPARPEALSAVHHSPSWTLARPFAELLRLPISPQVTAVGRGCSIC